MNFSGRPYKEEFLKLGFSYNIVCQTGKFMKVPFCLYCDKKLSNNSMREDFLQKHFRAHAGSKIPMREIKVCSYIFYIL